jgi:Peptidase family M23
LLALSGLLAGTAAAKPPDPPSRIRVAPKPKPAGKQIVFPVLGRSVLTASFGDPRGNGAHQGEDIMADKRTPAVAAEAGKVRFHTTSGRAGCMLYLHGRSGTTYLYVHLNNDLTEGNDNRGECVPGTAFWKGLRNGAQVAAGQPIGYVGDSGDANGASPHLHFETRPGGGRAVDPLPLLRAAKRLLFYAPKGSLVTLSMSGKVVAVGAESLRIRIATLRGPLGITLRNLGRPLTVNVPYTATVERSAPVGGTTTPVKLTNAKPGESVGVWTEQAVVTPAAQAGKDGVLAAQRVLLASA